MKIEAQQSLRKYNTFGLDVTAEQLVRVCPDHYRDLSELKKFLRGNDQPLFVLGGGSNMLLTKDVKGVVLKNEIKGIEVIQEFQNSVHLAIGGGENWHQVVLWAIRNNYGGIENLSLIPGTVGAAPIQNIGAYGVELHDVFVRLQAIDLQNGISKTYFHKDCKFGYRDSIFKRALKGKVIITKVVLRLSKAPHKINTSYGAIQSILAERGVQNPTIKAVSDAVIAIRSSKLPDPAVLGNAGSFFKNPEVSQTKFKQLKIQFPNIVAYPLESGKYKIPAGWLIEQCGWKGKRIGNTGSHAQQALVIVNYGGATGTEIKAHAKRVIESVEERFGIRLTPEVNIF
jgi:UDP-N-acetylmuramate dehydrogenase